MTPEPRRLAVRINYHEKDKRSLLLDCVEPILEKHVGPNDIAAFVKPGWQSGPHLSIVLRADHDQLTEGLVDQIVTDAREWLKTNPSSTFLKKDEIDRLNQKMVDLIGPSDDPSPIRDNNTVDFGPYEIEDDTGVRRIAEDFAVRSLPVLTEVLRNSADRTSFWVYLARLMGIVGYFCGDEKLRGGHLSFRSHSEAFLTSTPELRPKLDQLDEELRDKVRPALIHDAEILEGEQSGPESLEPFLREWFDALKIAKSELFELAEREPASVFMPDSGFQQPVNRFARHLMAGPLQKLRDNPEFISYRVLISMFYDQLPVLSFRPIDRFALCYAVAQACEEIYEIDWRYFLRGQSAAGAIGNAWARFIAFFTGPKTSSQN